MRRAGLVRAEGRGKLGEGRRVTGYSTIENSKSVGYDTIPYERDFDFIIILFFPSLSIPPCSVSMFDGLNQWRVASYDRKQHGTIVHDNARRRCRCYAPRGRCTVGDGRTIWSR